MANNSTTAGNRQGLVTRKMLRAQWEREGTMPEGIMTWTQYRAREEAKAEAEAKARGEVYVPPKKERAKETKPRKRSIERKPNAKGKAVALVDLALVAARATALAPTILVRPSVASAEENNTKAKKQDQD